MHFFMVLFFYLSLSLLSVSLASQNPILQRIPENSLFFSGNTQIINIDEWPLLSYSQSFSELKIAKETMTKEQVFFYELYQDFRKTIQQSNTLTKSRALREHYGLAQNLGFSFYTVGVVPVLSLTIDNEAAFLTALDQAEQVSQLHYETQTLSGVHFRSYPISKNYQFIVAIDESIEGYKLLILSIFSSSMTQVQKEQIIGLSKPKKNITRKVLEIENTHQYQPIAIGFFDFQEVIRSLFKEQDNPWEFFLGKDDQFINSLKESQCEFDMNAIAWDIPKIVTGYKHYDNQGQMQKMLIEVLLELENKQFTTQLKNFRGFIPDYIRHGANDNIMALGLGLKLSNMMPFFTYVAQVFRDSHFQCQALKKIQQRVAKFNPLMLAMFSGVIDGVQGFGFALQNLAIEKATDKEKKQVELSMLMSVSASEPLKLWQMLSAFGMPLGRSTNRQNKNTQKKQMLTPSDSPQKLDFPELESMGIELFIVLKGKHLVVYSAQQAEQISQSLVNEPLVPNGILQESINYTKINELMKTVQYFLRLPRTSAKQPLTMAMPAESCVMFDEAMNRLSQFSGVMDIQNDVVDQGVLTSLYADLKINSSKQKSDFLAGRYETYAMLDGCQLEKDGLEEIFVDGTGFYQQYSDDRQCFIFETRYRWLKDNDRIKLQYVSERTRPEGVCSNVFSDWHLPEAEYINDTCRLRTEENGYFSCVYEWDGVMNKAIYQPISHSK